MTERFCRICTKWHKVENWPAKCVSVRRIPERSSFPCPQIKVDTIEPVQSMADGKYYDSMSSLRRTYRADGNPQGEEYIEIGDAPMQGPKPMPHLSKAEISDLLDQTEAKISRGEVPQIESVHEA